MAEEFVVAFDIQDQGTAGTSVIAKKGTTVKKGEIPATLPLEMSKGAFLSVNNAKLTIITAESQEEACKIAGETYGNRGGISGACKKTEWAFQTV